MTVAEPIGPVFDHLSGVLAWIGKDKTAMSTNIGTISFTFPTTSQTPLTMKVKVEINSREHEPRFGFHPTPFAVENTWFTGATILRTYQLEELLGTKLRALHQRRKGRDLFDLDYALRHPTVKVDSTRIREAFVFYMQYEAPLTRTEMQQSLAAKMQHPGFLGDITPLLRPGIAYDPQVAFTRVSDALINALPDLIGPSRNP